MERETVNDLILRLWDAKETLRRVSASLDQIEYIIADEVEDLGE